MPATPARSCPECGSPLRGDQRYCLSCGARAGERDERAQALMQGARDSWPGCTGAQARAQAHESAGAAAGEGGWSNRLAPLPLRLSAVLVVVFLGFGVLLGAAAASAPQTGPSASEASHLKLVLPRDSAATRTGSSPAGAASSAGVPPAEAEATPVAGTATTPASTSTSASASTGAAANKTSSETGSGEQGSSGSGAGSAGSSGGSGSASSPAKKLPPIKHVFVIVLSDESYAQAFGPASTAPYLTGKLLHEGELLAHYDAVAHEELANGVALLSGQGPTQETAANCPVYAAISPAQVGASEQVQGSGCVYPQGTRTLPEQLAAKHLRWRAYVEGIDEAGTTAGPCAHPQLGAGDPTSDQDASTGPYATFRNPVVYFASLTGSPECDRDDVGVSALKEDLAKASSTPSFSYIVPDRCHDGNPTPCTPGAPSGMAAANSFLSRVVPEITASPAYREAGLIVITSDEAPSSGEYEDSSSCCGQPTFPNLAATTPAGVKAHGGGAVGALLLSPYVPAGTTSQEAFNHFSLLRTIEDMFSLPHIGYAALPAVKPLEPALFTASPSRSSH